MQSKPRLFSKLFLLWLPLVMAALFIHMWGQAAASDESVQAPDAPVLQWSEDFESYTPNSVFDPNADIWNTWTHSGLQDMFVYTDEYHSPNQSLKGHGVFDPDAEGECLGSAAYRPIGGYVPMEIEVWIRNGTSGAPPLTGCHPVFGALELSTEPRWEGDHRGLISFDYEDGVAGIYGGDWEVEAYDSPQAYLGDFELETWYHVKVRYELLNSQSVRLTYWVNDMNTPVGQQELPSRSFEGNLAYLGLWVGEHVAWHDDVTVYAENTPPASADLILTKTASGVIADPAGAFSYRLVVSNNGPQDVTNVVVTDELPAGVTFQSATPAAANCQESAGTVTCDIGALAAGASFTADLNVTAPASSGVIINSASVAHELLEVNLADNVATTAVLVSANPTSIFLPMVRNDG